jgi:LppP/LprE lipoprotein
MAAHAMRVPRRRRWPARLAGLLGTAALLGSGVAIVLMVMPQKDETTAQAPAARESGKGGDKKRGITRAQKKARRLAAAKLQAEGYDPVRLADWRPRAQLKVLLGRNDSGAMRAYFFADGKFAGYDDPATSNDIRVTRAGKSAVTLAYRVSTGSTEKVRFDWQDGALTPTGSVPPASVR